jgi:hypothetical protein
MGNCWFCIMKRAEHSTRVPSDHMRLGYCGLFFSARFNVRGRNAAVSVRLRSHYAIPGACAAYSQSCQRCRKNMMHWRSRHPASCWGRSTALGQSTLTTHSPPGARYGGNDRRQRSDTARSVRSEVAADVQSIRTNAACPCLATHSLDRERQPSALPFGPDPFWARYQ